MNWAFKDIYVDEHGSNVMIDHLAVMRYEEWSQAPEESSAWVAGDSTVVQPSLQRHLPVGHHADADADANVKDDDA